MSKETRLTLHHTTSTIIELVKYLFKVETDIEYILLGQIQSDYIEGPFGFYRQLNGANYYASVLQFLQAENCIRLRSLVKSGYNMSEIGQIFENVSNNSKEIINAEATNLLEELAGHKFAEDIILPRCEESIVYYVAGYI